MEIPGKNKGMTNQDRANKDVLLHTFKTGESRQSIPSKHFNSNLKMKRTSKASISQLLYFNLPTIINYRHIQ
jgi:hypothetical protein